MTELLPIVFQKGVNQSIDSRLAPPETLTFARNVRWRKDGRPEKRYGVTTIPTTGLSSGVGYDALPPNALTEWNQIPLLAIGSSVRQLTSLGWDGVIAANQGDLSHWGPGERTTVCSDESVPVINPSSGYALGTVIHVWDDGTSLYYAILDRNGAVRSPARFLRTSTSARVISCTNYIYILSKVGTTLDLLAFNPATGSITVGASPGTLDAASSYFDAIGRGNDFVIAYQSSPAVVTTKTVSGASATPTVTATTTTAVAVSSTKVGVGADATSNVFVGVLEPSAGQMKVQVFTPSLSGSVGVVIVDTDINNSSQPGFMVQNATTCQLVWGGYQASTQSTYMRCCSLNAAGIVSATQTHYGVSPASKPFFGPAYATAPTVDASYVWVSTYNGGTSNWGLQSTYYLVKFTGAGLMSLSLRRQLHVPRVSADDSSMSHLLDVLDMGIGYGFMTPLRVLLRFGNGLSASYGFESITFRSLFESRRQATRDTVTAGRVVQFSGGSLFEFDGAASETGFTNYPVIGSVTGGGGGALAAASNYFYRAVYEWIDRQGRRHRSAPSAPFLFATGANSSATLVLKPLVADAHFPWPGGSSGGLRLHVYRTLAGQGTYHRVTPNTGAPAGFIPGTATVSYTDLMADSVAAVQELLYTDGGVADNTLPPPCTFMTVCGGRVWLGGQSDRCVLTASKILVDGEPTQFSDLEAFSVTLPQKCTGLASIDGTIVAFSRERVYFVTGDGPNDQGVGSFNPPTELPTDVGCIDWRSVVETSLGVFFQGKRGIYLLPRGFNTPAFIGAEVESYLALYPAVISATLVSLGSSGIEKLPETTVRFVIADSGESPTATAVLVYDLRTGGWSVDDEGEGVLLGGTWSDSFITARSPVGLLTLQSENAAAGYTSGSSRFISTTIGTGDIRPFGVAGFGQFKSVVLMAEFRAACFLNVVVSVDGRDGDIVQFAVTAPDAGVNDGTIYFDITPSIQRGAAIRVTCSDAGNPNINTPSEGVIMQALFIEHELIGQTVRLAEARRQ